MELNSVELCNMVKRCLAEDVGTGDITTNSIVAEKMTTQGIIHSKEEGVIAGLQVAHTVFSCISADVTFVGKVKDGDHVSPETVIAFVEGNARAILTGERLALNFLRHLSGIATRTANITERLRPYGCRVVDTRKTTPGLRMFEKYAVRIGGGYNHRFGLYDAVLIKDNHIAVAGGIIQAVKAVRQEVSHVVKIEVEVEDLAGVDAALAAGADIIMLDNMETATMREAVRMIGGRALVEASGGLDESTAVEVAATGVDIISIGALTHSVKSLDISLDVKEIK